MINIKTKIKNCTIGAIVLLAGFGCSFDHQAETVRLVGEPPSGTAKVKIAAQADNPFTRIAKTAEAIISAPDMIPMISPLDVTDSTVEGVISKIPAGKKRNLAIYVYDQDGKTCYEGAVEIDVAADSTVDAEVDLFRLKGSVELTGDIIDTVAWRTGNLILEMSFSGNFRDNSGNYNDGVPNGPILTSDRFGRPESACFFDGVDDYLDIPYDSTLDCEDSISVIAWAKSDIPPSGYSHYSVVVQMGEGTEKAYGIGLNVNDDLDVIQLEYRHHWTTPAGTDRASLDAAIIDGAVRNSVTLDTSWHFYALTFDGDSLRGYVDSTLVGTKQAVPGTITNTSLTIGMESKDYNGYWKGKIDDVRVYHRVLTEDEIMRLRLSKD